MDILSYRGLPEDVSGKAVVNGGNVSVSASLFRIVEAAGASWFNFVGQDLRITGADGFSTKLATFTAETIERHYRCSNGLFWPLLHLYPEFVCYDDVDWAHYLTVQTEVAKAIIASGRTSVNVHDYQMFGVPLLLKDSGIRSSFFLHLPFPREVAAQYVWAAQFMVRGMLGAEVVGVHVPSYRTNLLNFVQRHMASEFVADHEAGTITNLADGQVTRVVVSPIGSNATLWRQMADKKVQLSPELEGKCMFILIGRSDPAKGVPNCVRAWALFHKHFAAQAENTVLLLISTPSREQVDCFKTERLIIEREVGLCQAHWPGTLVFTQVGFPAHELASYYRQAQVSLTCSKEDREGWGLTAPEFVACQEPAAGAVLGMSRGVGAFSRFGDCVLELDPEDPMQMAAAFAQLREKVGTAGAVAQMVEMQSRVPTMDGWWHDMQLQPVK